MRRFVLVLVLAASMLSTTQVSAASFGSVAVDQPSVIAPNTEYSVVLAVHNWTDKPMYYSGGFQHGGFVDTWDREFSLSTTPGLALTHIGCTKAPINACGWFMQGWLVPGQRVEVVMQTKAGSSGVQESFFRFRTGEDEMEARNHEVFTTVRTQVIP